MLKGKKDAQGMAIYDYFKTKQGGLEIIERDDGYIDVSDGPKCYLAPFRKWPAHHKKAMRYVRSKVLDIGCGGGRHAVYLQEKGFNILGIDISPLALKVCRKRGVKKIKQMSIRQISTKLGVFDTILMLGNNFGLFESYQNAKKYLKRFHKLTSAGGRIIAETLDPYATKNSHHIKYHQQNRKKGRMPGQVRIRNRYQGYCGPWFDYLFVSPEEMDGIIEDTGWKIKKILDSNYPRYIAIIDKYK